MPRKLRLEYAGAVYHVIGRGNYRADVFADAATKAAFLGCLDEACEKAGWRVHAWCVMSNHYHLSLETPQPNLVEGMRWLLATFSIRFNRFRRERGHVFQGRYQAVVVDPDAVGAVCHYIHLNPRRAGLVGSDALATWPWSSLPALLTNRHRPAWFSPTAVLQHAGGLKDTPAGRRCYLRYLGWLQEDANGQKELQFDRLAKDWAVGTRDFKVELLNQHRQLTSTRERGESGPREIAREVWSRRVLVCLAALNKTARDVQTGAKGAPWKVAVAAAMKASTTASNPWLAARLNMGSPFRLSRLVSLCRARPAGFQPYVRTIAKCKV